MSPSNEFAATNGVAVATEKVYLAKEKEGLLAKLPAQEVQPLWTVMHAMVPPTPKPTAEVAVWRYNELRPLLLEAGKLVSSEEAERRVLMLINPALKAPFTTDTIYAGLQLINEGETAPAHRHQAFALRFIIEGSRGFTAVDGQKIYMEEGDVILTPQWQWHDHGHEGDGPMIWLDGLDLPIYHKLPTHFAEPYHEPRYPSEPADSNASPWRFPWSDVKSALDKHASAPFSNHTYRNASGEHISRILGAHAERIKERSSSPATKDTCSYIYHVQSGSGRTEIALATGVTKTVSWGKSDTFAVPAWSSVRHFVDEDEAAYLFALSDRPLLEALGMYVEA